MPGAPGSFLLQVAILFSICACSFTDWAVFKSLVPSVYGRHDLGHPLLHTGCVAWSLEQLIAPEVRFIIAVGPARTYTSGGVVANPGFLQFACSMWFYLNPCSWPGGALGLVSPWVWNMCCREEGVFLWRWPSGSLELARSNLRARRVATHILYIIQLNSVNIQHFGQNMCQQHWLKLSDYQTQLRTGVHRCRAPSRCSPQTTNRKAHSNLNVYMVRPSISPDSCKACWNLLRCGPKDRMTSGARYCLRLLSCSLGHYVDASLRVSRLVLMITEWCSNS